MATGSSLTASSSTVDISFDVDPLGIYSFQVADLKKKTFEERVDELIGRIEKTITALERYSSRAVEEFTIGKTFAPARAHTKFDPENENTWRVDGISRCWNRYKRKGYDGLVVVGAVSRKLLTDTSYRHKDCHRVCNTEVWDQQSYALALESALICHYAFKTFDPRLANSSLHPGKKKQIEKDEDEDKAAAGGIVYFAFKYEQTARAKTQAPSLEWKYSPHEQYCQYSPNKRIIGSSTSQKHRNFVSDPILRGKDVTELGGIGEVLGGRLKEIGFGTAYDVLQKFLSFKKDREKFMDWLKDECGANKKQGGDCYNCLKEWSDKFL